VSNDDLLDVFDLVACSFDCGSQLMCRLVADSREDIADDWAPDLWIVLPAAGFPENEAFMRVLDEDAIPMDILSAGRSWAESCGCEMDIVHRHLASLVDETFIFFALD